MSKKSEKETLRVESLATLHRLLSPGDTVHTILRHVSASGMLREISLVVIRDTHAQDITWHAANVLGAKLGKREGIRVPGCGMDLGFHLVYSLSSAMYREGFECAGGRGRPFRCPSNDHANGDRDYAQHHHASGGYALRQRWL